MAKKDQRYFGGRNPPQAKAPRITTLYDMMKDGREYESIIGGVGSVDLVPELRRTLADIEAIRERPAILYAGNVVKPLKDVSVQIELTDDLPFAEMVDQSLETPTPWMSLLRRRAGWRSRCLTSLIDCALASRMLRLSSHTWR